MVLCCICAFCGASAEELTPYKVKWPTGWNVTDLPGPRPYSERDLGGKRARAIKTDDGKIAAVIELTYFHRPGARSDSPESEFPSVLKSIKSHYESAGYTVAASTPVHSKLGGLNAMEAEITTNAKGIMLCQWTAMAAGTDSLYSFSFTGLKPKFDKYKPDLEIWKQSLSLK
jgi:hypothetical protein